MSYYLNYSSTFFGGGKLNPSDEGYDEIIEMKINEEKIKTYIKDLVGAPNEAKVIFTSGATEGIATCINWIKNYNQYGTIYGTEFDHPSIKDNVNNAKLKYKKLDLYDEEIEIPEDASAVFLTLVSSKTGEILPTNLKKYVYLSEEDKISVVDKSSIRQYRPLIFADVTQSICKIPTNMEKNGFNAVFFSLHKLGGEFNTGVLVVDDTYEKEFIPLISGTQQNHLRGGTYNLYAYLDLPDTIKKFKETYDENECKNSWNKFYEKLESEGLDVYKPKHKHLYNTLLVKVNGCPMNIINKLSEFGIYISASTACNTMDENKFIRISFLNGNDINKKTMKKIIQVIKNEEMEN